MDPINPFDFIFHHFGSPEMVAGNIAQILYSDYLTKKIEPSTDILNQIIKKSPVNTFYLSHKLIDLDNIIHLANKKIEDFKIEQQNRIIESQKKLQEAMAKIQHSDLTKLSMAEILNFAEKIK